MVQNESGPIDVDDVKGLPRSLGIKIVIINTLKDNHGSIIMAIAVIASAVAIKKEKLLFRNSIEFLLRNLKGDTYTKCWYHVYVMYNNFVKVKQHIETTRTVFFCSQIGFDVIWSLAQDALLSDIRCMSMNKLKRNKTNTRDNTGWIIT